MTRHEFHFSPLAPGRIDRAGGVIYGVSIMTSGAARGHDLEVDQKTLAQLKACADAMGTVPVKWNHKSGADAVAGFLDKFRIEGNKLIADWHLLKSHPQFAQAFELAERMPQNVGLSAAFMGKDETCGGKTCARCSELISVDLVAAPAANPDGLFEAKESKGSLRVPLMAGAGALGMVLGAKLGLKAAQFAKYRRLVPGENLAGRVVGVGKRSGAGVIHAGVADAKGMVSHLAPGMDAVKAESLRDFRGQHALFVERGGRPGDPRNIRKNAEGIEGWKLGANCEHAAAIMIGRKPASSQLRGALAGAGIGGVAAPVAVGAATQKKKAFAADIAAAVLPVKTLAATYSGQVRRF